MQSQLNFFARTLALIALLGSGALACGKGGGNEQKPGPGAADIVITMDATDEAKLSRTLASLSAAGTLSSARIAEAHKKGDVAEHRSMVSVVHRGTNERKLIELLSKRTITELDAVADTFNYIAEVPLRIDGEDGFELSDYRTSRKEYVYDRESRDEYLRSSVDLRAMVLDEFSGYQGPLTVRLQAETPVTRGVRGDRLETLRFHITGDLTRDGKTYAIADELALILSPDLPAFYQPVGYRLSDRISGRVWYQRDLLRLNGAAIGAF